VGQPLDDGAYLGKCPGVDVTYLIGSPLGGKMDFASVATIEGCDLHLREIKD
jgi:hypothetical protein